MASVVFRGSGKVYYFPFRLHLRPVRSLTESLVRSEVVYVAENLLLRGGYRKTHFQADQTTLQAVSQMGTLYSANVERLNVKALALQPLIAFTRTLAEPPAAYPFPELVLQALVKKLLQQATNMTDFLSPIGLRQFGTQELEILGERALPEGYVDILIKEARPIGSSNNVAIEMKRSPAQPKDLVQLEKYVEVIGDECIGGALIAGPASSRMLEDAKSRRMCVFTFSLNPPARRERWSFEGLQSAFDIQPVGSHW